MDGDEVQEQVVTDGSPEGAGEQQPEPYDPSEILGDEAKRDAVISGLMADEGHRKQLFATNEAQSEINRTADARFRAELTPLQSQMQRIEGQIGDMAKGTRSASDQQLVSWWEQLSPEQKTETVTASSDQALQVVQAKERLQKPEGPAQPQNGAPQGDMNTYIWDLKSGEQFSQMSDADFKTMVAEEAGRIDSSNPHAYGILVGNIYGRRAKDLAATQKTETEAQKRTNNAQERATQGRPLTGGQRGAATGTVEYYEAKIADGTISESENTQYLALRIEKGMN